MKYFLFPVLLLAVLLVTCSVSVSADDGRCNGVADGIFLAHPEDCNKYFTCMGGKSYPATCSDSLFFDVEKQRCDVLEKTKCYPKCDNSLQFMTYPKTCNGYVMCFASTPLVKTCVDNLHYNSQTNRCDYPQNVDCVDNLCTGIDDPENIVYVNSKRSCGEYYICHHGKAMHQECTSGLHFNKKINNCDFKENVNCTISAKSRNVLPYAKMPPTRANISCPKSGSHSYPSPSDKSAYYFCANGKGIVLTCSPGLTYDRKMETCRDPKNIK